MEKLEKTFSSKLYLWISIIFIIIVVINSYLLYTLLNLPNCALLFLSSLIILAVGLFLNRKHEIKAAFLFAVTFPIFFLILSVFTLKHFETPWLIIVIAAKFAIILSALLPIQVLGNSKFKLTFWGLLPGLIAFILYDHIHKWFGINISRSTYEPSQYIFVTIGFYTIFFLLTVLIFFVQYSNHNLNLHLQKQRKELEKNNRIATERLKTIEEQNKHITNNIRYAQRIQKALLPSDDIFKQFSKDFFVINKPKDIISGDFYWINTLIDYYIIVVSDSTGHGVSGALMSMLGYSFLNEIINIEKSKPENIIRIPFIDQTLNTQITDLRQKETSLDAADILMNLRELMKYALKQDDLSPNTVTDSMDTAVLMIKPKNFEGCFAGANLPLFIISKGVVRKIEPDRMPVGIYPVEEPFTNYEVKFNKGDRIFMLTDGFSNQIAEKSHKRLSMSHFEQILNETKHLALQEQKQIILKFLKKWQGNEPQSDDILIVAFEF